MKKPPIALAVLLLVGAGLASVALGGGVAFAASDWGSPAAIGSDVSSSISCPTTSFCAAVGGDAAVWSDGTWTSSDIDPSSTLLSVSCTSASFCAATDAAGNAWLWNGTDWSHEGSLEDGTAPAVSCVAGPICFALDEANEVLTYSGGVWNRTAELSDPGNSVTALSCTSASFCAAVDNAGNAFVYDGTTWSEQSDGDGFTSVSCTSPDYCVAVEPGDAGSGTASIYNGTDWTTTTGLSTLNSVSCAGVGVCMAVDGSGGADSLIDGAWSHAFIEPANLRAVSCPTTTWCAAVDGSGNALFYDVPALNVATGSLPSSGYGAAYDATMSASGGIGPYRWTASGLPSGLSLSSSTGEITGTATTVGNASVAVTVTDGTGTQASSTLDLDVTPAPQAISFSVSPVATTNSAAVLSATGGASGNPVRFSVDAASTPGACALSGSTLSFIAAGTCIVDANQAGTLDFAAAAEVAREIDVEAPASTTLPSTTTNAPAPPTPTRPAAAPVAAMPTVVLSPSATATMPGRLRLLLECNAACRGSLSLSVARVKGHRTTHLVLARGAFFFTSSGEAKISLAVTKAGTRLLPRAHRKADWATTATIAFDGRVVHHRVDIAWNRTAARHP